MRRLTIELPSVGFSLQAPDDVLDSLRLFYPSVASRSRSAESAVDFVIKDGEGKWLLSRDGLQVGSYSDPVYALLALEFELENIIIGMSRESIALHAGGVVTDAGAWIIAGHPDTGKTSSTFQLLELGQAFLCEEIALYQPATQSVLPHLQTLALDRRFLEEYQHSFAVTSGELAPLDDHITRFVPRRLWSSPAVLDAILLPRYRPGEPVVIEDLAPESMLTEFLGYCFPPQGDEEALFDSVIDLLQTVRVIRLTYGSAKAARDLLSSLLVTP